MSGFSYWLRLRGLPFSSKPVDVCRFLKDVRLEGGLDGVYFGVSKNGKPSGEAFVEVLTEAEVEKALIHHKALIGNRYIEVYASSEDEMWRKTGKNRSPGFFVRLRGLPFRCLKEDIKMFFQGAYICPRGITLCLDRQERCNGSAFVEFATKKGIELALSRHRGMMGERYVEVFPSTEETLLEILRKSGDGVRGFSVMVGAPIEDRNPDAVGHGPRGASRGGLRGPPIGGPGREREPRGPMVRGHQQHHTNGPRFHGDDRQPPMPDGPHGDFHSPGSRMQARSMPPRDAGRVPDMGRAPSTPEHRVHVQGMPPSASAADLTKLFYPLAVMDVLLLNDGRGRATGEADVFFNSHSEAIKSLEVSRYIGNFRLDFYLHSEPGPADRQQSMPVSGGPSAPSPVADRMPAQRFDDIGSGRRGAGHFHQGGGRSSESGMRTSYGGFELSGGAGNDYGVGHTQYGRGQSPRGGSGGFMDDMRMGSSPGMGYNGRRY